MMPLWILHAFLSAFFAGAGAILAKIGIRDVDSNLATALRTVVVVFFAWGVVFLVGSQDGIGDIGAKTLTFLVLSGLATGASWLCYFRALQIGDVNKVVPVDKSGVVLTMLLASLFLGEDLSSVKILSMILIAVGTYMMIEKAGKKEADNETGKSVAPRPRGGWLVHAFLAAFFASLTAILGKAGIEGVESNLGTAIRTVVVVVMAWVIVLMRGKQDGIKSISRHSWTFIVFSAFATGLSWLFHYRALQEGPAGVVVPIDRLGILVVIAFGRVVFHEKLAKRSAAGLVLLTTGTLTLLL